MRTLTTAEIEAAVRTVESGAFPVSPRVLRRVITQDLGLAGWHIPHRKCWILNAERARQMVEPDELGLPHFEGLPPIVMLLARPDEDEVEKLTGNDLFVHYWRLLFHGRIDVAMRQLANSGTIGQWELRERVHKLGQVEFDEVHAVLIREQYLHPDSSRAAAWFEFVAVYFELKYFSPDWLPTYFPTLTNWSAVERLLSAEIDAEKLFESSRLPGGPESPFLPPRETVEQPSEWWQAVESSPTQAWSRDQIESTKAKVKRVAEQGNSVRAALLGLEAARGTFGSTATEFSDNAKSEMDHLAMRLQAALQLNSSDFDEWTRLLTALLGRSQRGFWNADARVLYDLQKVALAFEKQVYKVDTFDWLRSFGKRPIRRWLPHLREISICRDLRTAFRRLSASQLDASDRKLLSTMLHVQAELAEQRLRKQFRPQLQQTIAAVGLIPVNIAERVAARKVVEEVLDLIVEYGYFSLGQLRDVISRNNLKLHDLSTLRDVIYGGQLLELDRRLGKPMDGVYRRGEFYLRWLQRLSTVAFGTPVGRFLTQYVAIPFGGAHLILAGALHLWISINGTSEAIPTAPSITRDAGSQVEKSENNDQSKAEKGAKLSAVEEHQSTDLAAVVPQPSQIQPPDDVKSKDSSPDGTPDESEKPAVETPVNALTSPPWQRAAEEAEHTRVPPELTFLLGLFLLALIHIRALREFIAFQFKAVYHVARGVLIDAPVRFFKLEAVKAFLRSTPVVFFRRQFLSPLFLTSIAWIQISRFSFVENQRFIVFLGVFFAFNFAINSKPGRALEAAALGWLERTWYTVRVRFFVALFEFVVEFFKRATEWLERLLYAVDEWLRFKSGETRLTLATKIVLGSIWAVIAYVIRFAVTLLIEPQINPIKHFPVVTVSHKMILPMGPELSKQLANYFTHDRAVALATAVVFGSPGIFGFLVWELKENWRLFAANRPAELGPIGVGTHGESVPRILRPGFHSGVLPRLFDRLRKAARHSNQADGQSLFNKWHERRLHLQQAIAQMVDREFVALLREMPSWQELARLLSVSSVRLSSNSFCFDLESEHFEGKPVRISLEEQSGWVVADITKTGWISELTMEQRQLFKTAVLGFYKLCGVEVVREQLESALRRDLPYDIQEDNLVVWLGGHFEYEATYNLSETRNLTARPTRLAEQFHLPRFQAEELLFQHISISWKSWVQKLSALPLTTEGSATTVSSLSAWQIPICRDA